MEPQNADRSLNSGFSLIEAVVTLAVIAIISVGLVSVAASAMTALLEATTREDLTDMQSAVRGNPVVVAGGARAAFGYVGDMGNLPANIEDLWIKGSQPVFSFDTALGTGAGWNGPYLETDAVQFIGDLGRDAWGEDFFYDTTQYFDPTLGVTIFGKLASKGADGVLSNEDDLTVLFRRRQIVGRVQGFVRDELGNAVSGVDVVANFPQNGILTTGTVKTNNIGFYQFAEIPFGRRSLTPQPKLIYAPGTAVTPGANVRVTVNNFGENPTSITSLKVEYFIAPPAYFRRLRVGGVVVYNSINPRLASGDTVNFAAQGVSGTGEAFPATSIQIQSAVTNVGNISIGAGAGLGGSLEIRMELFRDIQNGAGGNPVNMAGVVFRLTFSDGSVVVFVPT